MPRSIKVSMIWSQRTMSPFVDEDRMTPIFTRLEDAVLYVEKRYDKKYLRAADIKEMSLQEIYTRSYAAGALSVAINPGTSASSDPHKITQYMIRKDFYNPALGMAMQRFLHTKNAGYLKNLSDCEFLFAVKIKDNRISYGIFVNPENQEEYLYIAFRDLSQFARWNMTAGDRGGWSPIKVNFSGLEIISGEHGIIVDPQGARFVITPHLKQLMRKDNNARV